MDIKSIEHDYDKARGIGLDFIKIVLSTNIVLLGVPLAFQKQLVDFFDAQQLLWIWCAWALLLCSLLLAFLVFLFIFEGYYHFAHTKCSQAMGEDVKKIAKLEKRANGFFDRAHYSAIAVALCFGLSLWIVIVQIICKVIEK